MIYIFLYKNLDKFDFLMHIQVYIILLTKKSYKTSEN